MAAKSVAEAERKIVDGWMKQFGKAQELPRQRVTQFSQWFNSFEPPVAGSAGVPGRRHLSPTFRMGVEVPGQYDALKAPPDVATHAQIVGFEPEVDLFRSKQFPKKLVARGSDGREYPFVAKGSEDLRQDDRIERLFRAMDALLLAHPGSRHRGLTVRTFHVAPLSARCGLLEFVGGTTPMLEAVRGSTKDGNNCVKEHQFWIRAQASAKDKDTGQGQEDKSAKRGRHRSQDWHVQASNRPRGRQVRFPAGKRQRGFPRGHGAVPEGRRRVHTVAPGADNRGRGGGWMGEEAGPLGTVAVRIPPAIPTVRIRSVRRPRRAGRSRRRRVPPRRLFAMRRRYAATSASSVCGWVAGVGDRHLQNVLVDLRDGSLVHIDFGYAFGTATAILPIPSSRCFRGHAGDARGRSRPTTRSRPFAATWPRRCTRCDGGSALLRGVMDVFLREPLIDWQREARLQSMKSGRAAAKKEASSGRRRRRRLVIRGGPRESRGSSNGGQVAMGLSGDEARVVELKVAHAHHKLELGNPCHVTLAQCAPKHEGQGALGGDARPRLRRHSWRCTRREGARGCDLRVGRGAGRVPVGARDRPGGARERLVRMEALAVRIQPPER